MLWKEELYEKYPHGEIVSFQNQPHYCWRNWFFEIFVGPVDSKKPKCYLQFDLNFDSSDLKIFKRAKAAGLLSFHFFAKHAQVLQEQLELNLDFFEHAAFKTNYVIQASKGTELLAQLEIVKQNHITIMEQAIKLIRELNSRYELSND